MKRRSCETCPYRLPMDKKTWAEVAEGQRKATPNLSRSVCKRLTEIERERYEGLEANVKHCKGYSPLRAIGNYFLSKVSVAYKTKRTEAGGLRFATWDERTCNNPYLDSVENFALADQFQATGKKAGGDEPEIFKDPKQKEAVIEDAIGMQKGALGMGGVVVGAAIMEVAPEILKPVGGAIAGLSFYVGARGGMQSFQALRAQVQQQRNNQ